jgi:hypothetical protein
MKPARMLALTEKRHDPGTTVGARWRSAWSGRSSSLRGRACAAVDTRNVRKRLETDMPDPATRANALDHVVVVLFENRSLDNVLGRLYGPGDGKTFEGVIGKELRNPIPGWAEHGADRKVVPYGVAADMDSPTRTRVRSGTTSTPRCSGRPHPSPQVCPPQVRSRSSYPILLPAGICWLATIEGRSHPIAPTG